MKPEHIARRIDVPCVGTILVSKGGDVELIGRENEGTFYTRDLYLQALIAGLAEAMTQSKIEHVAIRATVVVPKGSGQ